MNNSIIFLHGFPYDSRMWKHQIDFFSKLYKCHAIDLPGSGKLRNERVFSLEDMCNYVISYIKQENLNKPILVGLSMGGYIALRILEKEQDLISKLILMDTRYESDPNEAKIKRAIGIQKLKENNPIPFITQFVENSVYIENIEKNPEIKEYLIKEVSQSQDPLGLASQLLAMQGRTETNPEIINIPTLVLCGEYDNLTPGEGMKNLALKIKGSKFSIVPNSGHIIALENPDFVNKSILDFLKERTE